MKLEVRNLGELRRAIAPYGDDCPLVAPVEVTFTFDMQSGGRIGLHVVNNEGNMPCCHCGSQSHNGFAHVDRPAGGKRTT